ncbi:uncharacterized protein VTP21DRAFT_4549 [Calcarisporiella thermophila]|uniref:uncharacterized protein n=1 Tax=Calcarisporiella thermophila TaxID=911321 RepID=UPI0037427CDD
MCADTGRKDFTTRAKEAVKPDSQKSTTERASENISGGADRLASRIVPDSQKSTGQQVADTGRGAHDQTHDQGKGIMDKAKDALGMGDKH